MKIVEQTSTQLSLRSRPWVAWIAGSVFTTVGLFPAFFISNLVTLNCQRTEDARQCQLITSGLIGSQRKILPLNQIQQAIVAEQNKRDGSTYRVVLLTQQGEVPFTDHYSGGREDKQTQTDQINAFLRNTSISNLSLREDNRWWGFLFAGLFGGVGVLILVLFGQVVTCRFDQTLGQFTMRRRGLFSTTTLQHPLKNITAVNLETSESSDGDTYLISLELASGDRVSLTEYYSSGYDEKQAVVQSIQAFLQLSPPTASEFGSTPSN